MEKSDLQGLCRNCIHCRINNDKKLIICNANDWERIENGVILNCPDHEIEKLNN